MANRRACTNTLGPPAAAVDYRDVPEYVREFVTIACLRSLAATVPVDAVGLSEFFQAATSARDVGMCEREHFHAQMWLHAFLSARPARLT